MAAPPFQNIWHIRTVAEASSKSCYVCYKPTTKVMITPDSKDYFYICQSHLSDRGFASPIVDKEAEAARLQKEALDREIEKVKAEYEEKQRKKKAKKKGKDKDEKEKEKDKKQDDDDEKDRDEKIQKLQAGQSDEKKSEEGPRIYALQKNFYQMRLDRLRNLEIAKRNQQRMANPNLFPAVPKNDL